MSYFAIAAAVIGTGIQLYQADQAADKINSIKPKKFVPIPIEDVKKKMRDTDVLASQISRDELKGRQPRIPEGIEHSIAQANAEREGRISPQITGAMDKAGLSANLGNNAYVQAKNMGLPILSKDKRDRNYFQRVMSQNPWEQMGATSQDELRMRLANTGGQNVFNQGVFGSRMGAYSSQVQQNAMNTSAALVGLAGTFDTISKMNQQKNDPYTNATDPRFWQKEGWDKTG